MNTSIHPFVRAALLLAFASIAFFANPLTRAASPVVLQFTAASPNITGNIFTLNSPHLNGKPTLRLIVTQDTSIATAVLNPHPIGVYYNTGTKEWEIFNEDLAAMPVGAIFNVLIPAIAQRVNGSAANSFANQTYFSLRKHDSGALLLETHVFDPFPNVTTGALDGVFQVSPVGLFFNPVVTTPPIPTSSGCWEVYNESVGPALATSYNIADVTKTGTAGVLYSFLFTTTAANVSTDYATINNSLINDKPNAILFISHVSTAAIPVADKFYCVVFNTITFNWIIFSEDMSPMPVGASFVVTAFPAVTGT